MTGYRSQFVTLETKKGVVIFGDNICITPFTYIKNILLVDDSKYNLLCISQLYDKDFKVIFGLLIYIISSPNDK